jgi:hypothetical protein
MSYFGAAGHWLTYSLVVVGILYVAGLILLFMGKSWRRARKIGYTREQLWRVVKNSLSYTLVPAIAILAGFFSLAPMLGIPLSWWRLSIIGNTVYELMAADTALRTAGVTTAAAATSKEFILVMYTMAVGIMGGMLMAALISKSIQKGTLRVKNRDPRWGALAVSTFILTLLVVLITPLFSRLSVALLTLLTSAAAALGLNLLIKQYRLIWLRSFSLVISMLTAMASSILWTSLLL